ncbi:CPBP family intramembrane glutamic endopeptidase ['Paenibacillus yunnanensis' Narsing Rao et al. 2020]|uniref:CPBP family intramembrane glutamic endopeptidase n=1 Tax=Paenibacillus tengchongensis TaxID=2608684 RepID=UPI00124D614C|nr:CPBP family intramembrane glutamic endopeptidase [Paenibacillus tengchongensis]
MKKIGFCFMIGLVLTMLMSIASAAATIMELSDNGIMIAQGLAFLAMGVGVTLYMRKRDRSMAAFGFGKWDIREDGKALYYLPLLVIALVQPVMGGFDPKLTAAKILLVLVFSALVGYTEEAVFRGIMREKLRSRGAGFFIVFSSLFFGVLHMANALSGKDALSTSLQIVNALLIGFILALLLELTGRIVPLILFHFLFDALAQMTNPAIESHEVLVVSVLNVIYLAYGLYLIYALRRGKATPYTVTAA